jgi:predicted DNA-binding transcriptional regulator AlpA
MNVQQTAPVDESDRLLSTEEAARFLGCSQQLLADLRWRGGGPPYVKLSRNCVRYFKSDLIAYARERVARSTTEAKHVHAKLKAKELSS